MLADFYQTRRFANHQIHLPVPHTSWLSETLEPSLGSLRTLTPFTLFNCSRQSGCNRNVVGTSPYHICLPRLQRPDWQTEEAPFAKSTSKNPAGMSPAYSYASCYPHTTVIKLLMEQDTATKKPAPFTLGGGLLPTNLLCPINQATNLSDSQLQTNTRRR